MMKADSSLVSMLLAIGRFMNSLSLIKRNLTLNKTSSVRTFRLLVALGSMPWRLHSDVAHRSRAENRLDSCVNCKLSRDARFATSWPFSSSKRSCEKTTSGFASITLKQVLSSREQAQAERNVKNKINHKTYCYPPI